MNDNPQAIRIANEIIRPMADRMVGVFGTIPTVLEMAQAQGWEKLFPDDDTVIADGSDVDGRNPITNRDVRAVLERSGGFVKALGSDPEIKALALKLAVNPR